MSFVNNDLSRFGVVDSRESRYHAYVSELSSHPQHSGTYASEEERGMWLLKRLRVQDCSFGLVEFSLEVDPFLGPELENKIKSFPRLVDSDLVRIPFAIPLEFCPGPTCSDT